MLMVKKILGFCKSESLQAAKDMIAVKNFPHDVVTAGKMGVRKSKFDGKNSIQTVGVTAVSITRKGIKPHLPGIFAGLGFCVPAPLGSVVGFGLGKVLQRFI